jgi:hypothetical protein
MAQQQEANRYWPRQPKDLDQGLKRPPGSEGDRPSQKGVKNDHSTKGPGRVGDPA